MKKIISNTSRFASRKAMSGICKARSMFFVNKIHFSQSVSQYGFPNKNIGKGKEDYYQVQFLHLVD